MKKVDRTGSRFGRLVVVREVGQTENRKDFLWECRCVCGNLVVVKGGHLQAGNTRSCGCLRSQVSRERLKLDGDSAFYSRVRSRVKAAAIRRGKEFALSLEDVRRIVQQDCAYCGASPDQTLREKDREFLEGSTFNGIDRVNNAQGYTPSNTVACCMDCNLAKRCMSLDGFKDWIRRVHLHMGL